MSVLASGLIDWEHLTGQSKFVIDIVSIPIFSAIAGILTNWTGVLMLFAPTRFTGFYVPGLKTLFPFLPRKLQILPIFAPGGILGFQGFVPARAEKMASFISDKALVKIGSPSDFYRELDPDALAARIASAGRPLLRPMVDELMRREHAQLWRDLPPRLRELLYRQLEARFPEITKRAFDQIGDNIEQLVDIKLLAVGHMRRYPELLKFIFYSMGAPELRFMTRIGILGAPLGLLLALYLQVHHSIPVVGLLPHWLIVLLGAAVIGIVVNIIAIKVVFTPGEPKPRYKCLWKQAKLAKRQPQAAADLGHVFGYTVITLENVTREVLDGPRGDRTRGLLEDMLRAEIASILGPIGSVVRAAVGAREFDAIQAGAAGGLVVDIAPVLTQDEEFTKAQSGRIEKFCTAKLRALSPGEFMDMLYSAIEQDAWLLYAHGGFLGIFVGAAHLLIFGA
ncbi:hypothetical protein GCM10023321_83690 [Pseudonocardia eucalypti]|uniref:DUF445 domain-containing protein n=1 Tax=Pseudonocardia eucalypti TaxID=648755 RepID=A0ABP9RFN5_9PSEU|nr:uncharacterized membrane protein YheB (UPF0754 family) [Pseudonocardia eucalypti]